MLCRVQLVIQTVKQNPVAVMQIQQIFSSAVQLIHSWIIHSLMYLALVMVHCSLVLMYHNRSHGGEGKFQINFKLYLKFKFCSSNSKSKLIAFKGTRTFFMEFRMFVKTSKMIKHEIFGILLSIAIFLHCKFGAYFNDLFLFNA